MTWQWQKFSKPPIHIGFGDNPGLVEDRKMKIERFCGGDFLVAWEFVGGMLADFYVTHIICHYYSTKWLDNGTSSQNLLYILILVRALA